MSDLSSDDGELETPPRLSRDAYEATTTVYRRPRQTNARNFFLLAWDLLSSGFPLFQHVRFGENTKGDFVRLDSEVGVVAVGLGDLIEIQQTAQHKVTTQPIGDSLLSKTWVMKTHILVI